jgi:hypothetical protein
MMMVMIVLSAGHFVGVVIAATVKKYDLAGGTTRGWLRRKCLASGAYQKK